MMAIPWGFSAWNGCESLSNRLRVLHSVFAAMSFAFIMQSGEMVLITVQSKFGLIRASEAGFSCCLCSFFTAA